MTTIIAARLARGQSGAGLIETMVGILIGLLVVLVVYNMLAVAEGYKRMTTGAADAQITGLISQFLSSQDAGNGGNGYTSAYADLINCHNSAPGVPYTANNTLKPISVLVTRGRCSPPIPTASSRTMACRRTWCGRSPSERQSQVDPGTPITVQSPNGFNTPAKASIPTGPDPFWAIAIANDGSGVCELIQISNAGPPNDVNGEVVLTQGPTYTTGIVYKGIAINEEGTGAFLLNLGRQNQNGAARVRYTVANNQLVTTNCMFPDGCLNAAAVARPIAQNVVWMKVQYGIDTTVVPPGSSLDGTVDCWTPADDSEPLMQRRRRRRLVPGYRQGRRRPGVGCARRHAEPHRGGANRPRRPQRRAGLDQSRPFHLTGADHRRQGRQAAGRVSLQLCGEYQCRLPEPHPDPQGGSGSQRPAGRLALSHLRGRHPASQLDLQRHASAMTPISRASFRSMRRQRGVVLFVALIAMVILSLAGVALVRTVDSSMGVAGNLAFRNISMAPVNHGIEESIKMIFKDKPSPAAPFTANVPGQHYFASLQAGETKNGVPAMLAGDYVAMNAAYTVAGFPRPTSTP